LELLDEVGVVLLELLDEVGVVVWELLVLLEPPLGPDAMQEEVPRAVAQSSVAPEAKR